MSRDRDYLPGGLRPVVGPPPEDMAPAGGLSVLVVGYRRPDLLARCLDSIREHLPEHRVLVWDNSGADAPDPRGLADLVAAQPDVDWKLSATNVGFAAAVNGLVERAGGDDLLLLNPDAELLGPLTASRRAIAARDIAAVAPLVEDATADRHQTWDVAHRRLSVIRALVAHSGYATSLRRWPVSDLYPRRPGEVHGYLTGACLLISRAAWTAIGPFDEEFFLYGEESDWQQRARAAGWRLLLVDEPGIRHTGHGTVAGDPAATQRSDDLLRANVALNLEHGSGVHRADLFLAGMSMIDRAQRSRRAERTATRRERPGARPSIVITTNRLVFGGAERQHAVLAAELERRGYRVVIACMQRFGPLIREIPHAVRVVRQPWWSPALDLPGPAIVISGDTNTETGYAALWRRRRRDRRWLVAAHIPPEPDRPTYSRPLAAAMRAADGFIALSPRHWAEATAHQQLGDRWFTAPNGVTQPGDHRRGARGTAPLQLTMLSRIVESKNPQLLVAALAGLTELDWELSIFGDGPDRERLEALTPPAVRDRVHWRGWSPGPDVALHDSDLLCVPSRSEAFPLVILEAMARGVPVAASAVCAVPDMLDEGRAGILVDPIDESSWRETLRGVLTAPEALPGLGRAGLDRMRELYTVDAMVDAYEAAFEDVLARPGGRPTQRSR